MARSFLSPLLFAGILHIAAHTYAQSAWQYLGQPLPGDTPALFAPAEVSTGNNERDIAFSPNGKEMCYSVVGASKAVIVMRRFENGQWTSPEIASFSGGTYDIEPAYSPDGTRLYFASRRSLSAGGPDKDFDIWYAEKQPDGSWSGAVNVGAPVNTEGNEFYPSVTKSGTLYYTARLGEAGLGGEDIVYSRYENGKYLPAVAIDSAVNSQRDEYNAFVDPDEQFIIFGSWQRPGAFGGGDLYISRKGPSGKWLPAQNMGANVNSPRLDYCPFVSPDGKWLFFTSEVLSETDPIDERQSFEDFVKELNEPGNGRGDIYWVKFGW